MRTKEATDNGQTVSENRLLTHALQHAAQGNSQSQPAVSSDTPGCQTTAPVKVTQRGQDFINH